MKKTLAALLVAVMLMLSLVSCGDGSLDYSKVNLVSEGYVTLDDGYKTMGNFLSYFIHNPSDEEIRQAVPSHLDHMGVTPETLDRVAANGDLVNINYVGTIDGVAFDGGTADNQYLVLGSKTMIDGFESGIVGMRAGITKTIDVTFPEDYAEDLAGKDAQFAITLNAVCDSAILEDPTVVAHVKEELTSQNDSYVWQILQNYVTVNKYPEKYVEKVAKTIYKNYEYSYRASGYMEDMDVYGITMETCTEEAKTAIDEEFAIYAFVQAENITYTDEEYEAKAAELAPLYGFTNVKQFKAAVEKKTIEMDLYSDKVVARVIEINDKALEDSEALEEPEDEHDHEHDHEHEETTAVTTAGTDVTTEVSGLVEGDEPTNGGETTAPAEVDAPAETTAEVETTVVNE